MSFIATQATQSQGLLMAMQTASWVKSTCQNAANQLTGNVTSDQVLALTDLLRQGLSQLNQDAAIPGIAAYAQAQFSNSGYNISAEFTNMVNAITACVAWVVANFPKDAQGFIQEHTLEADGSRAAQVFTPAQTAGLTSALNAVIATIA